MDGRNVERVSLEGRNLGARYRAFQVLVVASTAVRYAALSLARTPLDPYRPAGFAVDSFPILFAVNVNMDGGTRDTEVDSKVKEWLQWDKVRKWTYLVVLLAQSSFEIVPQSPGLRLSLSG